MTSLVAAYAVTPRLLPVLFLMAPIMALCGCAVGMSPASRAMITSRAPFASVKADPERYRGEVILTGGRVIEAVAGAESGSGLVVLQMPLGSDDVPVETDASEGRFIVRSPGFLDPEVYPVGALVTVIGRVKGGEYRPVGEFLYLYPVLEPVEIKVRGKRRETYPNVFFSIGVGTVF